MYCISRMVLKNLYYCLGFFGFGGFFLFFVFVFFFCSIAVSFFGGYVSVRVCV